MLILAYYGKFRVVLVLQSTALQNVSICKFIKNELQIKMILLQQQAKVADLCWDTSTSSQVSNCDGVVLEIYLDHKFQWPQEGLNYESLAYEVVP